MEKKVMEIIGTALMTFGQETWHKILGFLMFLAGTKK
jgi:hypothetical protein